MVADIDEDVVAIHHVEGENEWMLHMPQVGQDEGVKCANHSRDANQDEDETQLRWNEAKRVRGRKRV